MNTYKERIRSFLSKYIKNVEIRDDEDIFKAGFINSLFAMRLIVFVENEFTITVDNEDLKLDNFRSINAMSNLIERKKDTPG